MDNVFNKISLSLIGLALVFYLISNQFTALIPGFIGGFIQLMLMLGRQFPSMHKHFAHLNLFFFGMGCGATYKSIPLLFGYLLSGNDLDRPLATLEQFLTFVLCLIAILLGVQSFINARKK
jgi:hypothetical protein